MASFIKQAETFLGKDIFDSCKVLQFPGTNGRNPLTRNSGARKAVDPCIIQPLPKLG